MELFVTSEGLFVIREIPAFVAELFRRIPRWADQDSEKAEARLFPSPSSDEDEDELRSDWKAHVQPELYSQFHSAREIVDADLRRMEEEDEFSLSIARSHVDAWIHALNQARLAIAAEMEFTDAELEAASPSVVTDERDLALFQIGFYALIQQWMIEQVAGPGGEPVEDESDIPPL
jgi:hypothetical protein